MFPFFIYLKEWKHFTYFFTTYKPKAPVAQTPVRHLAPLWTAVITAVVVVVVIDVVVAVSACLSRGRRGVGLIGTWVLTVLKFRFKIRLKAVLQVSQRAMCITEKKQRTK